jgi:hypothetical protein
VLLVTGQMLGSIVFDHFGLIGVAGDPAGIAVNGLAPGERNGARLAVRPQDGSALGSARRAARA